MKKKTIVYDYNGNTVSKKILLFDDVMDMRVLSNNVAWKIIEILTEKAMYPAQIARELKLYEQTVYYYIRKLLQIGAIEQVGTSLVKGGTARLYSTTSPSFGLELDSPEGIEPAPTTFIKKPKQRNIPSILRDYFKDDKFSGLIVVGAPDPHGPYKSSARDGHYAVHLSFYLGTFCDFTPEFIVKLDVDAKVEKNIDDENLILIGGPGTNIVTSEFNKYLPIKFNEENYWSGLTDGLGRVFNMDNHGLIAKIKNPYNSNKSIIVLAGVRTAGTKAAVIALTNHGDKIFRKNGDDQEEWTIVVQGFDMDADGKIDHVDIVS